MAFVFLSAFWFNPIICITYPPDIRYTQTGLRSESSSQPRNIMHPFCDHICVVTVFFSYRIFFLGRVRGSPKLLKLAQAANPLPAPFLFSTLFYKIRYQTMADFAERCLFSCEKTPQYCINSSLTCDFSPLYKKTAAFLVRIRGPPSEI